MNHKYLYDFPPYILIKKSLVCGFFTEAKNKPQQVSLIKEESSLSLFITLNGAKEKPLNAQNTRRR